MAVLILQAPSSTGLNHQFFGSIRYYYILLCLSTVLLTHQQKEGIIKISQAVTFLLNYHRSNSSTNTIRAYKKLLARFCHDNGEKDLNELTSDAVLAFLNDITEGKKPQTRKTRYSHLTSFFNFTKNNIDQDFQNPCDSPIINKMFRAKALTAWDILEKEIVDEIIFKADIPGDRLMLELMARGGMRIGEVLKLTPRDVIDRKLIIRDPKAAKKRNSYSFRKKLLIDSKIISGKMAFNLRSAFSRYAMKLQGQ